MTYECLECHFETDHDIEKCPRCGELNSFHEITDDSKEEDIPLDQDSYIEEGYFDPEESDLSAEFGINNIDD